MSLSVGVDSMLSIMASRGWSMQFSLWTSRAADLGSSGAGFKTEAGVEIGAGAGVGANRSSWNGIGASNLKSNLVTRLLNALCMNLISAVPSGVEPGRWPKLCSISLLASRKLLVS